MEQLSIIGADCVRSLYIEKNVTLPDLQQHLQEMYPSIKLSISTIRRFLDTHNIRKKGVISDTELDQAVTQAVHTVGGTYGRKMMKGYLDSIGIKCRDKRVAASLKRIHPENHYRRQQGTEAQINPMPYYAPHFGYNLHMDQNEKITMYGVTFVVAIDGCSGFITAFSVSNRKNNKTIYHEVYKHTTERYGLFETVIVDHGKEFVLSKFIQRIMSQYVNSNRPAVKEVESTKNNRVERWWVEQNKRVGYPLKYCLLDLEAKNLIDRDIPHHLFVISQILIPVAEFGTRMAVNAWNHHFVPNFGRPIDYLPWSKTFQLAHLLPDVGEATHYYIEQTGGQLAEEAEAGKDLLEDKADLQHLRMEHLNRLTNCDMTFLFSNVVNFNYVPLQSIILQHIRLSENLLYASL